MISASKPLRLLRVTMLGAVLIVGGLVYRSTLASVDRSLPPAAENIPSAFSPREQFDSSGFGLVNQVIPHWKESDSLAQIAGYWKNVGYNRIKQLDKEANSPDLTDKERTRLRWTKAILYNFEGDPDKAYATLEKVRADVAQHPESAGPILYTLIYYQGLTALRLGENENCVQCRGTSACIIPFDKAAIHLNQRGSRLAVKHFTEYLGAFPKDMEVRWLLNLAQMTLGEYPEKVDPNYLISLDRFARSEFDIGKFDDISYLIGLDAHNEAGGAIMDDFDNDGRLDLVISSFDPTHALSYYRNTGAGRFEPQGQAGLAGQLGGLNCTQTDYNNDGRLDIFVVRGAWLDTPIRPSLLRNNGDGTFTDVTVAAGLQEPVNSNSGVWADYDNDGFLDLFVSCEKQPSRLYHNQRNSTFKDMAGRAGLLSTAEVFCKGGTWIDYNGDDFPDLFANYLDGTAHLFRNERNGRFSDVSLPAGIDGPSQGFSCWTFDYDNDGRQDLFATSYDRTGSALVKGLTGEPHPLHSSKLYRNVDGTRFEDQTAKAGLDAVFSTMGSNFADFDNDGFLDMYLATGDPNYSTLVPNRMFKNVNGERFSEITASSRTGHLQKGHGVACGDWDRDGNVDLFVELGGAAPGDRYHSALFQNPGHQNRRLTVKLVGKKTNRAAIGARIKIVTAGKTPRTIYRHVSSGSSFGGNPLQQTVGLGEAERIATLEIRWPTSRTTQTFRDVAVNQCLEITESATKPRVLNWPKLPVPAPTTPARPIAGISTEPHS